MLWFIMGEGKGQAARKRRAPPGLDSSSSSSSTPPKEEVPGLGSFLRLSGKGVNTSIRISSFTLAPQGVL